MAEHELIVALDVPSAREAAAAVAAVGDAVSFYKVGLELFLADGPETLRLLKGEGKRVFLDLKLHDIPRTVERAVGSCLRYGADLLTIHSQGSTAMVEAAARAVREAGADTKILAVTLLTSLDASDLDKLGVARSVEDEVLALGRLGTLSSSNAGLFFELDAIAAVVIGGASMSGGRGTVSGTVAGVLVLGVLSNVLQLWGVDPALQGTVKGLVIVLSVLVQRKSPHS